MRFHFKADPPIGDRPATGHSSQQPAIRHVLVFAAGLMAMFAVALAYKWFFTAT